MDNKKPILYAEDDENDAFLMTRVFKKLELPHPLKVVSDGKLAIAYLAGIEPFADREQNPMPCLVFMDLSMPRRTGLEVLRWKQEQPGLEKLPVVILTSSNQQSDIERAREFGANGFLIKPGNPTELMQTVKGVVDYWLSEREPGGDPPGAFPRELNHSKTH